MKCLHALVLAVAAPILGSGCADLYTHTTPELDAHRPKRLCFLPVADRDGGANCELVRELVVEAVESRGYVVEPCDATVQVTVVDSSEPLDLSSRNGEAEVEIRVQSATPRPVSCSGI